MLQTRFMGLADLILIAGFARVIFAQSSAGRVGVAARFKHLLRTASGFLFVSQAKSFILNLGCNEALVTRAATSRAAALVSAALRAVKPRPKATRLGSAYGGV